MAYLTDAEIDEIVAGAMLDGLDLQRSVLFRGREMTGIRGKLQTNSVPESQIRSDLSTMNESGRAPSGIVPLERWLAEAARLTPSGERRSRLDAAREKVLAQSDGVPDVPDRVVTAEIRERIILQDDLVPYGFLEAGTAAGESVARIKVLPFEGGQPRRTGGEHKPHLGTAWLVGPRHVLTNHHVVNARSKPQGAPLPLANDADLREQGRKAVLEWDYLDENVNPAGESVKALVAWDVTLDYALLELHQDSEHTPLALISKADEFVVGSLQDRCAVNIIQHPGGAPKQVGLRNNLALRTTDDEVHYFTDTRAGSSGSPVMDDRWQVVALHRAARSVTNVEYQGKTTAYVNVGTRISSILKHVTDHFPDVALA